MKFFSAWPFLVLVTAISPSFGATGTIDNALKGPITASDAQVEEVISGLMYTEGPVMDQAGNLYFSEWNNSQQCSESNPHRMWRITPEGGGADAPWRDPSNCSNGMDLDSEGRVVVAEKDMITRVYPDLTMDTVVQSTDFWEINDVTVASTGEMFFSNFSRGDVYFVSADGQATRVNENFSTPNGVEWNEGEGLLYVNHNGGNVLFDVGANGTVSNRRNFAGNGGDGITIDENGNVYVAIWPQHKILVMDPGGNTLGSITINAANVSNCSFGGPDNDILYITGETGVHKVQMAVKGRKDYMVGLEAYPWLQGRLQSGAIRMSARQVEFNLDFPGGPGAMMASYSLLAPDGRRVMGFTPMGSSQGRLRLRRSGAFLNPGRYFLSAENAGRVMFAVPALVTE